MKYTYQSRVILKYTIKMILGFYLRPIGTDPKIKLYFGVNGTFLGNSKENLELIKKEVLIRIE